MQIGSDVSKLVSNSSDLYLEPCPGEDDTETEFKCGGRQVGNGQPNIAGGFQE